MQRKEGCIFCDIVAGEAPSHLVWQDEDHIAFLSIFPNTEGVTVVIPRDHHPSYIFEASDIVMVELMHAARTVARILDEKLENVGRTAVVFEGFGVDHLHAKLFPLHGTVDEEWHQRRSNVRKFFDYYEGYISSHDHDRADDARLAALAKKLRGKDSDENNDRS